MYTVCSFGFTVDMHNISVDRVGAISSPPTAVTGSPHSQATPGSPVTSSVLKNEASFLPSISTPMSS